MRDNEIRIPRDVKAHVNKKRIVHIAWFSAIELLLLSVFIIFADDIFVGSRTAFPYVAAVIVLVVPAWKLKIFFWLFDKTWAGEIIRKDEENYLSVDNSIGRRGGIITNKKQDFLIRLDSGKVVQYTVYDNRARYAFRRTTYNVGDRVIHVGCTDYIQAVAVGEDDTLICVVCGAESRADLPECHVCGKTLKID